MNISKARLSGYLAHFVHRESPHVTRVFTDYATATLGVTTRERASFAYPSFVGATLPK